MIANPALRARAVALAVTCFAAVAFAGGAPTPPRDSSGGAARAGGVQPELITNPWARVGDRRDLRRMATTPVPAPTLAPRDPARLPATRVARRNDDEELLVEEDLLLVPSANGTIVPGNLPDQEVEQTLSAPSGGSGDEDELLTDAPLPSPTTASSSTGATLSSDPPAEGRDADSDQPQEPAVDPHWELFSRTLYPSAKECSTCHEKIYREWSVSSHAYASISPMFTRFEDTINGLAQGTLGYFCLRCHAPVAVDMGVAREANIWENIPAAREGVTCIACHRVVEGYGRVNGERRIETGPAFAPVVGVGDGQQLHQVISQKDHYKVKTSPDDKRPGQLIHNGVVTFEQVGSSHFCVSCHQVAVFPGIKLEVVWEQYRASPACKTGIRCQDCHMGAVPGRADGFETAPIAVINGKEICPDRRHSNHMFVGPGYSIAHPGLFPFNPKADRWHPADWLLFDWRAGWGTEQFEEQVEAGKIQVNFPPVWKNVDDRYDAREVLDANRELLAEKTAQRQILMEKNSEIQGPFFKHPPRAGSPLRFHYEVKNLNSGHNMPSGSLGAQPQLWLNVVLTGPRGEWIWESGYVDSNGDIADVHSLEVAAGRVPRDLQLFNLQTKFLITGVKGTDREMYLPINVDFDQLPFIRPSGFPITTLNHPPFIRMEAHSLPPLGTRHARYHVPARCIQSPGKYRLSIRMRSRAEPIYFMRFCKATPEMERSMNENMLDFHQQAFEFFVR